MTGTWACIMSQLDKNGDASYKLAGAICKSLLFAFTFGCQSEPDVVITEFTPVKVAAKEEVRETPPKKSSSRKLPMRRRWW